MKGTEAVSIVRLMATFRPFLGGWGFSLEYCWGVGL